ncbi:MAG: phosphotransferase [Bacillota bacterium]|nr:phosphotransferase [Bacillota bacterium]
MVVLREGGAAVTRGDARLRGVLEPFLGGEEVDRLLALLARRARVAIATGRWFVKARTDGDPYGLETLRQELRFLQVPPGLPVRVPALRGHYASERVVVLLFDRLEAAPLAEKRNAFCLRAGARVEAVLEEVLALQRVAPLHHVPVEYERRSKLGKYLPLIAPQLDPDTVSFLEDAVLSWADASEVVLSHGDLLPANILLDRSGGYWLVDWEYASLRPPSYDPALFLLFSHPPAEGVELIAGLTGPWEREELYRDAVVIAAREIKNWMTQVPAGPEQARNIELWRQALRQAIKRIRQC